MRFSFLERLGFSLLLTVWLIWGVNVIGNVLVAAPGPKLEAAAATGPGAGGAKAPAGAPAADLPTLLAAATPRAGEKAFGKCKACHTANRGGPNRLGPNLWDVVGSDKAARAGFGYSAALKGKGGQWTYDELDQFLAKPNAYAPGTKMSFAGLGKLDERAAVIAYLRSLSASPKPLP